MDSVDYQDTFITVAPDSTAVAGIVPPSKAGKPTVASATFQMIADNPYAYRSSEVIFTVWADRRDIPAADRDAAWGDFYAKGQACLRGSDLGKRYGWGITPTPTGSSPRTPSARPDTRRSPPGRRRSTARRWPSARPCAAHAISRFVRRGARAPP
jgi:hypothetical protein